MKDLDFSKFTKQEIKMVALLKHVLENKDSMFKYLAIRKLEINLNKNMEGFGLNETNITLHDLTRFLIKYMPDALQMIDDTITKYLKEGVL